MRGRGIFLFRMVSAFLVLVWVCGCSPGERREAAESETAERTVEEKALPENGGESLDRERPRVLMSRRRAPEVREHAWDLLPEMDAEEKDFGMYTYVLFARRPDSTGMALEVRDRYAALLEAIAGSTLSHAGDGCRLQEAADQRAGGGNRAFQITASGSAQSDSQRRRQPAAGSGGHGGLGA